MCATARCAALRWRYLSKRAIELVRFWVANIGHPLGSLKTRDIQKVPGPQWCIYLLLDHGKGFSLSRGQTRGILTDL
jgi:hypothetical protein